MSSVFRNAAVSIIVPMYNSSAFLLATVQSVIRQTYQDWELILIDDCSADGSISLAELLVKQDARIRLLKNAENFGAAVTRNRGIEAASGRYICFLDSDDLWLPNKLEVQVNFMLRENVSFSFSAYDKIDEFDCHIGRVGVPEKVTYHQLLKCSVIGCLTAMYDADKLGKIYMPLIRKRQDLGLWLRLLKRTNYAYGINQPLAQYRVRADSISANKLSAASYTWRLYREVESMGFFESAYYFSQYAVRGFLRTKCPGFARKIGVLV